MESAFQFTNPALTDLEFKINEEFNKQEDKEVQLSISMSVQVDRSADTNEAIVGLTFELGEKGVNVPFYVKAVEKANFRIKSGNPRFFKCRDESVRTQEKSAGA